MSPGLQVIVFDKYHEVSSNTSIPLVNTDNRDLYILGSGRERVRDLTAHFQRKYLENFKLERLILLIVSGIGYSIILTFFFGPHVCYRFLRSVYCVTFGAEIFILACGIAIFQD